MQAVHACELLSSYNKYYIHYLQTCMLSAGNILPNGQCRYMKDLSKLDTASPGAQNQSTILASLTAINTPLVPAAWSKHLKFHPDQLFTMYILSGITQGFKIGYGTATSVHSLKDPRRTLYSA